MSTSEYPTVSCVICHHKGNLVLDAIQSLKYQKYVVPEIIVVTSEKDRTFYQCKTLYLQGGPDKKRNSALRLCTSEYIAFFDDDIEADPECVSKMLRELKQDSVGMVFGKLRNFEHRDMFDEAGSFQRGDERKDFVDSFFLGRPDESQFFQDAQRIQ